MHEFTELAGRCTAFTLGSLNKANERTIAELQKSGATTLVKSLQMIRLQKAIFAIGLFSIFEAILQDRLNCANGFAEAKTILDSAGEAGLREQFDDLYLAVNVLKHGRGQSYERLEAKAATLPFRVKLPGGDGLFDEGDVSEISTLIEVDDAFVNLCGVVISEVSRVIKQNRSDFY